MALQMHPTLPTTLPWEDRNALMQGIMGAGTLQAGSLSQLHLGTQDQRQQPYSVDSDIAQMLADCKGLADGLGDHPDPEVAELAHAVARLHRNYSRLVFNSAMNANQRMENARINARANSFFAQTQAAQTKFDIQRQLNGTKPTWALVDEAEDLPKKKSPEAEAWSDKMMRGAALDLLREFGRADKTEPKAPWWRRFISS